MLVELGNHAHPDGLDDRPKVTTIHIPEGDETGLGGYSHKPGVISVSDFRNHRAEANDYRNGITRLPDHEVLLACVNAWPKESQDRPDWVSVTPHLIQHSDEVCQDVAGFLREFYGLPDSAAKPADVDFTHWNRWGAPGQTEPMASLPDVQLLYTNAGRVVSNINDGGGQVGLTGTATATTATSLTSGAVTSLVANQYAGYRLYAPTAWANILSHTSGTTPVFTIDRWYAYATPGGSAASTPTSTTTYVLADGGAVSSWFVAMTTTNITPAATDTALSGEYTTAGGGCIRKIAPYAQTSGTASRTITLTPVYTANGSDTFPSTFFAIGVFNSMVVASTPLCMKFETSLNASATINTSGDQITVTETITGS